MRKLFVIILILSASIPSISFAQEIDLPETSYVSGTIINTYENENGLALYTTELRDGSYVEVDSFGEILSVGNRIFLEYFPREDTYNFVTVNRSMPLALLTIIFVVAIILLSQKKGVRSLASLALSLGLLLFGLIPLLIYGYDPIVVTVIFGLLVLGMSIFVTHGFNYQSLVSFIGSVASILVAIILLYLVQHTASLTGLINDEIQFLSFELKGTLDLVQIVSASIIVGILGVLDDITITQVSVVRELSAHSDNDNKAIFTKALRVGRDHISSLVNTLVFAYVGATLPMIMFITLLEIPFMILISQEFIFIEIIRSLIGAVALTLAVPVTTWLASFVFIKHIRRDQVSIESACGHSHHEHV